MRIAPSRHALASEREVVRPAAGDGFDHDEDSAPFSKKVAAHLVAQNRRWKRNLPCDSRTTGFMRAILWLSGSVAAALVVANCGSDSSDIAPPAPDGGTEAGVVAEGGTSGFDPGGGGACAKDDG
jgi:hypothetical protein